MCIRDSPLVKLILLGLIWLYLHHFCAGIRYLLLDLHKGIDLESARLSSKIVFAVSIVPVSYTHLSGPIRDIVLAKPNYSFEKRQRDLEKKRKQEEKRLRKLAEKKSADDGSAQLSSEESACLLYTSAAAVQVATRFTVGRGCGLHGAGPQWCFKASGDQIEVNLVSRSG